MNDAGFPSTNGPRLTDPVTPITGAPLQLDLPTDRPRPAVSGLRRGEHHFELSATLVGRLHEFAQNQHANLYLVALAAFNLLLHRYCGQDAICVASTRQSIQAGAAPGGTDPLGMVFLECRIDRRLEVSALIERVRQAVLQAVVCADAVAPQVQVLFDLAPGVALEAGRPDAWSRQVATLAPDLACLMRPSGARLSALFDYDVELFDAASIGRMQNHFERLLEAISKDPRNRLGDLPMMTAAERRRILVDWNDTATVHPAGQCLHQLFEEQVQRRPQACALVFQGEALSYGELNTRANRLAHHLRSLGVGPDVLVGLCLARSAQTIIAMLAIVKAGGAYLPMDPEYPAQRLAFMLRDAAPRVVLSEQSMLARLGARPAGSIVCLDRDEEQIAGRPGENLANLNTPENLVYVIYTSGSTGQPKGVLIEHRAVSRLVIDTDYVRIKPSDCVAQASNQSFDAATFEVWGALLNGARLAMVPKDELLSASSLAERIRADGINTMFLTTALFNELSMEAPAMFAGMDHLIFGGEAGDPRAVERVMRAGPPRRLLNGYGPTETTTFASWYQVPAPGATSAPVGTTSLPIGIPIANTQIFILDRHLEPTPVGLVGEIYIGGVGVARGYLNRPELSDEKFIADPSGPPGSRLYRTGDLGCWRADGIISYRGRIDQQIKLRGFRIEPGEIEGALRCCAGVRDAVVMMRERAPGDARLIAWFVAEAADPGRAGSAATGNVSGASLRSALRDLLPDYMIPSTFVQLDALALTANGKIDRAALIVPSLPSPRSADGRIDAATPHGVPAMPADAVEAQLLTLWEDTLDARPVGLDEDFFELGGHSLLAVQMLAAIEHQFGKSLRLSSLFEYPTIRQLATLLRLAQAPANTSCVVTVRSAGTRPPIFFVSGWGGAVLVFNRLSRELGPDQPLYVLDNSIFGDDAAGSVKLEEVAAQMIEHMRAVQPQGPYNLCGFSLGGKFVYEMAQQLHRSGDKVSMLALMDCHAPGYPNRRSFAVRTLLHIRHALGLGPRATLSYLLERVRRLKKYVVRVDPKLFAANATIGATPLARAMQHSADVMLQAWDVYQPRFYPGDLVLIRAEIKDFAPGVDDSDPQLGWGGLIGKRIELHSMPCGHRDMLEPEHAAALARILSQCVPAVAGVQLRANSPAVSALD